MSNAHIQWLQKQLEALKAERANLDEKIEAMSQTVQYLIEQDERERQSDVSPKSLRNTMLHLLTEEGKPLHYKDLHARLAELGIQVPGRDPIKNTGAHLSADERFESLGNGLWGLVSWRHSQRSPQPVRRLEVAPSKEPLHTFDLDSGDLGKVEGKSA